jgi:hypothetical protein
MCDEGLDTYITSMGCLLVDAHVSVHIKIVYVCVKLDWRMCVQTLDSSVCAPGTWLLRPFEIASRSLRYLFI